VTNGASHRFIVSRHDAGRSSDAEIDATLKELEDEYGEKAVHDAFMRSRSGALVKAGVQHTLQALNFALSRIIDAVNPRLEADAIGIGTGYMLRMRISIRDLAKKYGLTPAAISKRAIEFCDETGLPPSGCMRSLDDRETYAMTNRTRI
jgi:hypothetical protein